MLTLKIPSIETRFSVSEAFAFASVLLFGPDVGVVTLALDGIRISFRWKMNLVQTVFNSANLGLAMWAAGYLFFAVSGAHPLYLTNVAPPSSVLLCLGLMTAGYYAVNSGLIAAVVGLSSRRSMLAVWREHYLKLFPSYAAGAAVAMLLVLAFREVQFTAIALSVPFVLICYLTLRSSFGRLQDAKTHVEQLNRLLFSTVETLATAIDAKDEVTHDHVRRVQQGTMALARAMGVTDPQQLQAIEAAALLHDTGKIAVPEHILNKPGKLTPAEFEKMKRHAPIGAEILSSIDFPYPVAPIVRHHHENWDGTGYPDRLRGEEIPIGARILSVVDCFDALTSDRPYRRRMSNADAIAILTERRGTMYDPKIVDTFVRAHQRIMPATEAVAHGVAKTLGGARAPQVESVDVASTSPTEAATSEVLAVASLARAISGDATIADVGALTWMMLRQVVPCTSMGIFLYDESADAVTMRYADGMHAASIRGTRLTLGAGIAGWSAANRRFVLNSDPAIDLGPAVLSLTPPLRSSLTIPLIQENALVAVLSLYAATPDGFTNDHARLMTLLAPSLATSIASLGRTRLRVPAAEPRRMASGELRLLKRGS